LTVIKKEKLISFFLETSRFLKIPVNFNTLRNYVAHPQNPEIRKKIIIDEKILNKIIRVLSYKNPKILRLIPLMK